MYAWFDTQVVCLDLRCDPASVLGQLAGVFLASAGLGSIHGLSTLSLQVGAGAVSCY